MKLSQCSLEEQIQQNECVDLNAYRYAYSLCRNNDGSWIAPEADDQAVARCLCRQSSLTVAVSHC